jgi:alpha-ketoglutaric semialdehyde dehydrogenase
VQKHELPEGTFSLLVGTTNDLGGALVTDPRIRAVGFTGSRGGGLALVGLAAGRPVPIPVYAEMSAINPVFVLPGALAERGDAIATSFVTSVTGSSGQLCTKPGLLFVLDGPDVDSFVQSAAQAISGVDAAAMLSPGIAGAFAEGVQAVESAGVEQAAHGAASDSLAFSGTSTLFVTDGATFLREPRLRDEMFGPASVVIRVSDEEQLAEIIQGLEGQLTATLHTAANDHELAGRLLGELELIAGRVLFNGWPTGVEVGHAMVHGGPYPATSAPATTSVGTRAIERFLRPVAYQDAPEDLLPPEIRSDNPYGIFRRVDGVPEQS